MYFIDDEDFVAGPGRRVLRAFTEFADIVNTGIGGRIDFENVDRFPGRDLLARRARVNPRARAPARTRPTTRSR